VRSRQCGNPAPSQEQNRNHLNQTFNRRPMRSTQNPTMKTQHAARHQNKKTTNCTHDIASTARHCNACGETEFVDDTWLQHQEDIQLQFHGQHPEFCKSNKQRRDMTIWLKKAM
jgi:hypothetical protein